MAVVIFVARARGHQPAAWLVMDGCSVGRGARLRRCIVEEGNHVPKHEVNGGNAERDRQRFHVSDTGIVVVPRGHFARSACQRD